jgi:hypothetical protein
MYLLYFKNKENEICFAITMLLFLDCSNKRYEEI